MEVAVSYQNQEPFCSYYFYGRGPSWCLPCLALPCLVSSSCLLADLLACWMLPLVPSFFLSFPFLGRGRVAARLRLRSAPGGAGGAAAGDLFFLRQQERQLLSQYHLVLVLRRHQQTLLTKSKERRYLHERNMSMKRQTKSSSFPFLSFPLLLCTGNTTQHTGQGLQ